jgi:lipopolysaccharide biosynthesis glycosyltransferase
MIKWFIGHDPVETGTYHVMSNSLMRHSSMPISITPVTLKSLEGILTRDRHPLQSNDFAFSRFLVPWMCNFEGWAVFSDCDMIVLDDPAKLWALRDDRFAVKVVHHNHIPEETTKYLGTTQTKYARKNWSSVVLWNCAHPSNRILTPENINIADGLELHQFRFLNDDEIGYLPKQWNYLVGYDKSNDAKLVHYTTGGPYFEEYRNCDYHQDWWKEKSLSETIIQTKDLKKRG